MMRLTIVLPRPLDDDTRTRLLLACAAMAKVTRVRARRGAHQAEVFGEAVSRAGLAEALAEAGVAVERIDTSLDEVEDAQVDDRGAGERVRPIGR